MTRKFRFSGLAMGVAIALWAGAVQAEDLVISNWEGYIAPDAVEKFNAKTGNNAQQVFHATNEDIMGKVLASKGKGYDVLFISSPFAEVLNKLGYLEELDHDKIPNLANLYPEASQLAYDPGNKFSIPFVWGTSGLCYRSDLVPAEPTSWYDLLKPSQQLESKTTMVSTARWLLGAGFLAKGYSVNEIDPVKLAEVRDLLIKTKPTLLAYDDSTFFSKLVSGEAWMSQSWDGWCNYAVAENPNVKYVIPKEGSDLWIDTMVILKGSQHKEAAYAFLNRVLDADTHRWTAENVYSKLPNKAAMDGVSPDLLAKFSNMNMSPSELIKHEVLRDVGEAQRDYARTVSEIIAAN